MQDKNQELAKKYTYYLLQIIKEHVKFYITFPVLNKSNNYQALNGSDFGISNFNSRIRKRNKANNININLIGDKNDTN